MNLLALNVALRILLFGGSFLFTLAVLAFIAYDGRRRWIETLPWLALSLTASLLTLPALCFTLLGMGTRYQSWAAPLACLAFSGIPLALLTTGLYVTFARSAAPSLPASTPARPATHAQGLQPHFQAVCRNPACRAPLEPDERQCSVCGRDQERPVSPGETLPPGPASDAPDIAEGLLTYLVVRNGPQAGTNFRLGRETDIGSGEANQIVLQDPFVGREHACIRRKGTAYVFYDMSALSGSYLIMPTGRERIDIPYTLRHGDMIEIGNTVLVFMQAE